jgi:eukaryotic-like serine/threonine-protein kinase
VAACSGIVSALDKRDGTVRWLYDIRADGDQRQFHGDPLVADKLILYGTDGAEIGHVYAFDRVTGEVVWKVPSTRRGDTDPGFPVDIVRHQKLVYAVDMREEIVAIELETGSVQWRYSIDAPKWLGTSPAVANGKLFFGSRNGSLYAFDALSGKLLWKRDLGGPISATPAVIENNLIVGTSHGDVLRMSQSGKILSRVKLDEHLQSPPTMIANSVILITRRKLMAIDPALRHIRWKQESSTDWSSPKPREFHGNVVAGNDAGELLAFDPRSGARQWMIPLAKSAVRGIGSDEEVLYVGNYAGDLMVIAPGSH